MTRGPDLVCEHRMSRPCYFLRSKVGPERERGMLGIGGAHNTLTSDTRGGGLMSDLSRLCNNHKHRTSVQPSRVLMQFVITGWCAFIHPLLCWRPCSMSNMTRPQRMTPGQIMIHDPLISPPGVSAHTPGGALQWQGVQCENWDRGNGNWASELLNNNESVGVGIQVGNKIKQSASYGGSLQFLYSNSMATQWT